MVLFAFEHVVGEDNNCRAVEFVLIFPDFVEFEFGALDLPAIVDTLEDEVSQVHQHLIVDSLKFFTPFSDFLLVVCDPAHLKILFFKVY